MRKPYSDEVHDNVFEKYVLGESVREIHDSTGISVGSISEYINDFSSKIDKQTIDAMHHFFRIIRKNGMQPKDAFYGHVVFSVLKKYNLDPKQIYLFAESVLSMATQSGLSAEKLVDICNTISEIQSNSDVSLDEIENHCTELVKKKNELETSVENISEQYKQSEYNLSVLLKKNNLTEQQVEKITHTLKFLENLGFDFADVDSACNLLQNAKSQGYDVDKIYSDLNQDASLELTLHEKQTKLDDIEKRIRNLEKKHQDMSLRHENLVLRHASITESIDSVDRLVKNSVTEKDIIAWQKLFDSFGLTPRYFLEQLEKAGNAKKLFRQLNSANSKLKKENKLLEKKNSWMETHNNELKLEISNGTEFGKNALSEVSQCAKSELVSAILHAKDNLNKFTKQNQTQIDFVKKQCEEYLEDLVNTFEAHLKRSHELEHTVGKMESLKPLIDLVNGKFDPVPSISQIISILDKAYVGIKGSKFDKHLISSDIKRLREKLLDLINNA